MAEMREYPSHLRLSGRTIPLERVEPPRRSVTPSYTVMKANRPPVIDGFLADWEGVSGIRLDSTNRRGGPWESSTDLSGELRMVWDKQSLYFALEVEDDIVNTPLADHSDWENDCCQFAFDGLLNGPFGSFDDQDLSLCASRRPHGPVLSHYRVRGTDGEVHGPLPDKTIRFTRTAEGYIYEWSLPWERLAPVSPWILGRSGFSFTINDNDHEKFDGALGWTNGLIYGLNAEALGEIVFEGALGARDAVLELPQQQAQIGRAFTFYQSSGMGPSSVVSTSNRSFTFHESLGMGHVRPPMSPNQVAMIVRPAADTDVVGWIKVYRPGQVMPYAVGRPQRIRCGNSQAPMALMMWDLSRLSSGIPASEPLYVAFDNSLVKSRTPTPMAFRPNAPATQIVAGPSSPPPAVRYYQQNGSMQSRGEMSISADLLMLVTVAVAVVLIGALLVRSGKAGALAAIAFCLALTIVASFFSFRASTSEVQRRAEVREKLSRIGATVQSQQERNFVAKMPLEPVTQQTAVRLDSTPVGETKVAGDAPPESKATAPPTTAPSVDAPPKKPDWLDAKPAVIGSTYRVSVKSGLWATPEDCQTALHREIVKSTHRYIDALLGPGASDLADLDAVDLETLVKVGEYSTHTSTSVGLMQQDYALLEFTEPIRQQLLNLWRRAVVNQRLVVLAWVVAGVLLVLLLSYAVLRRVAGAAHLKQKEPQAV